MNPKIIPSDSVIPVDPNETIFFLGGPILGGGDWQKEAIKILWNLKPDAFIACPHRFPEGHELYQFQLATPCRADLISVGLPFSFGRSTGWERFYMTRASKNNGCIIFWLPEEDKENPLPKKQGPYGRDTYGEIAEWRVRMELQFANVVVGGSSNFSGISVIEENFKEVIGRSFVIHRTLEETIKAGVVVASK